MACWTCGKEALGVLKGKHAWQHDASLSRKEAVFSHHRIHIMILFVWPVVPPMSILEAYYLNKTIILDLKQMEPRCLFYWLFLFFYLFSSEISFIRVSNLRIRSSPCRGPVICILTRNLTLGSVHSSRGETDRKRHCRVAN